MSLNRWRLLTNPTTCATYHTNPIGPNDFLLLERQLWNSKIKAQPGGFGVREFGFLS
jgi:hypothetical protein